MNKNMPRTAYYYGRLSTAEQLKGHGKKRQSEGFFALTKRHTWTAADEMFVDDGMSAFSGANLSHGELGRFFRMVAEGTIPAGAVLVCESLDRLVRPENMAPALRLWSAFLDAKISVATVVGDRFYDAADPDFGSVLLALSEMDRGGNESRVKSYRLKEWWKDAREQKKHTNPPAWLRQKNGNDWPLIPERVKVVRDIFRLCREGVSLDNITKHLNEAGVPPMGHKGKNNKKKTWNSGYVYKLLTNRAVLGEFTPHVGSLKKGKSNERKALETIPGFYPPIMSEDEFFASQQALKKRRAHTGPRKNGSPTNLFTGICRDAWDGSVMSVAQKRADSPNKMLVSYSAACGEEGSRYMGIRYKELELAVLKSLVEINPADLIATPEGTDLQALEDREKELVEELGILNGRLAKKTTAVLAKAAEDKEEELEAVRAKIDSVKTASAGSLPDQMKEAQDVIRMMEDATEEERVKLRDKLKTRLALVVDSIWVYAFTSGIRKGQGRPWPQKWFYAQVYLKNGVCYEVGGKQGEFLLYTLARHPEIEVDLRKLDKTTVARREAELVKVFSEMEAEYFSGIWEASWRVVYLGEKKKKLVAAR